MLTVPKRTVGVDGIKEIRNADAKMEVLRRVFDGMENNRTPTAELYEQYSQIPKDELDVLGWWVTQMREEKN
jgi:hypothetical protein